MATFAASRVNADQTKLKMTMDLKRTTSSLNEYMFLLLLPGKLSFCYQCHWYYDQKVLVKVTFLRMQQSLFYWDKCLSQNAPPFNICQHTSLSDPVHICQHLYHKIVMIDHITFWNRIHYLEYHKFELFSWRWTCLSGRIWRATNSLWCRNNELLFYKWSYTLNLKPMT